LVVAVAAEHLYLSGAGHPQWSGWSALAGVLGVALAMWVRPRYPAAAVALVCALVGGTVVANDGWILISYIAFAALVSFLVGRWADRVGSSAAAVGAAVVSLTVLDAVVNGGGVQVTMTGNMVIFMALPWLSGRYLRQVARNHATEIEQAQLTERARIAQEMHDSLGHELSLIALRAGALEVAPGLSESHQKAAGDIRTAAAGATERLGQIVGVHVRYVGLGREADSAVDVHSHNALRVSLGHGGCDVRAEVTALRAVPGITEPAHEFRPHPGHAFDAPPALARRTGEREPWYGRNHDVEGEGRIAAVCPWIRQQRNGLGELDERVGPPVGQDQRERAGLGGAHMQEMDVVAVDFGEVLRELVECCLVCPPVVAGAPVIGPLREVAGRHTATPVVPGHVPRQLIHPARPGQPVTQVIEVRLRNLDAERTDIGVHDGSPTVLSSSGELRQMFLELDPRAHIGQYRSYFRGMLIPMTDTAGRLLALLSLLLFFAVGAVIWNGISGAGGPVEDAGGKALAHVIVSLDISG
jgi:hypothetical protein